MAVKWPLREQERFQRIAEHKAEMRICNRMKQQFARREAEQREILLKVYGVEV